MTERHVSSADRQVFDELRGIAQGDDPPVLMLNENRYTTEAGFPDGSPYRSYMTALEHAVGDTGGQVLWRSPVGTQVVGCEHERYDEILAVWYPSHSAFLNLRSADGAEKMFEGREICVEHAMVIALPGDRHPHRPE